MEVKRPTAEDDRDRGHRIGYRVARTSGGLLTYPPLYVVVGATLCASFGAMRSDLAVGGLVLCGLISLYGYLAKSADDLEPAQVGDNCYFIGFVYTLVVISLSIYFDRGEGAGEFDNLLQAVSVALVTSIWGMLMRFVLAHGEKEPEQMLDRKIRQVSTDVSRLSISLENSVAATNEYAAQLRKETQGLGQELNKEFAGLIEGLAEKVEEGLSRVHFQRVHDELKRAVDGHIGTVGLAIRSLDRVGDKFNPILEDINRAATALAEASALFKKSVGDPDWKRMGDSLRGFSEQVSGVGTAIDSMLAHYRRLSTGASNDLRRMEEVRRNLQVLVGDLRKDIDGMVELKGEYRKTFEAAASDALKETHKLYARLIGGAEIAIANSKRLGELGDDIRYLAEKIEDLKGNVAKE